tara:strand:- start:158 stop:508 length:351 start_codon:yes stop_codon:yes gene_type:complete
MILIDETIVSALKILTAVTVFFVWVVRYENIKREFLHYNLPKWVRDPVGILKISFTLMIQSSDNEVVIIGSSGIAFLMTAAIITHIRVKNPIHKMLPAFAMLTISLIILIYHSQLI